MDRVETLRTVFWWGGWASLVVALLGVLATWLSLPPQPLSYSALPPGSFLPQPTIMTVVSLPYHLVLPVALFFAWGALTALCEIHDRLEEQADLMSGDESPTDAA